MSLSVDGVWKAGVWATTVWADGVWREGAYAALPDSPLYFELIAPPSTPSGPGFAMMPHDPQVDRDFEALARMATVQSYLEDVEQWMNDELGADEELANVFEDDSLEIDAMLSGKGLWRGRGR